jgi:hypothetical protein
MHHWCFWSGLPEGNGRVICPKHAASQIGDRQKTAAVRNHTFESGLSQRQESERTWNEHRNLENASGGANGKPNGRSRGKTAGSGPTLRHIGGSEAVSGEYFLETHPVGTLMVQGETWFRASEICEVLEIGTPRQWCLDAARRRNRAS